MLPSTFLRTQVDGILGASATLPSVKPSLSHAENGDILFVKTGSTYGKTALVSNLTEKATLNPQVVVLKEISINNVFLGYVVAGWPIKKQVEQIVVGGAVPTMSQKEISKMKFMLPTKREQQKIADCLTALDALTAAQTQKIAALTAHKKGLLQQLFPSPDP